MRGGITQNTIPDQELSKRQVGKWLCNDPTGKSEYTSKADGTWSEEGTYFFSDGNYEVHLKGEWYKGGYYYKGLLKATRRTESALTIG
jgi:hypothetical protein